MIRQIIKIKIFGPLHLENIKNKTSWTKGLIRTPPVGSVEEKQTEKEIC